jgi:hypothetical protein
MKDCRNGVAFRERDQLLTPAIKERIGGDNKRGRSPVRRSSAAILPPVFFGFVLRGWSRRSRGPGFGLRGCVGQALTTEAIAECIRSGGVWEAESNIDLLALVSILAATDWDASFTVERINL